MGYFEATMHVGITFTLPLPTRILGLCCNTYTHTYLYQLEFWGFIAILASVLTFTNYNFGV